MSTRTFAVLAGLAVAALLGGTASYIMLQEREERFAGCNGGTSAAEIGGPFTLVNGQGVEVTDRDVITKPTLLYFGYTFCPDVCPLDTVRNVEAVDVLTERGYDVQAAMITIDPKRDTPEAISDFTYNISPDFIGLTGSDEQVNAAARAYRVYYNAHDEEEDEFYLVDHSTFTYLVFPDDGFAGFFRRELSGEQLADQVACFLDAV